MTEVETKMKEEAFSAVRVFLMKCGPHILKSPDHAIALDFCDLLTDLCTKPWMSLEARKEALDLHGELLSIIRRNQWE